MQLIEHDAAWQMSAEKKHGLQHLSMYYKYFPSLILYSVCSRHAGVMDLQDMTLRPSLKDIDEELLHLVAEQSAANDMLAEKRQKDQALLEQMLPPQVNTTKPCHAALAVAYATLALF